MADCAGLCRCWAAPRVRLKVWPSLVELELFNTRTALKLIILTGRLCRTGKEDYMNEVREILTSENVNGVL